jgi:pyridoxamine 5'-phosphate oxidase
VISAREVLEQRAHELAEQYCDRDIDCPAHWGGFRLVPDRIEFWKGGVGRLHDRILYELQPDESWTIKRLAP